MAGIDHHLAKRGLEESSMSSFEERDNKRQRFLEYTSSNNSNKNSTTNETLPTSQQDLQAPVMVDDACELDTSIAPICSSETVCFGTLTSLTAFAESKTNVGLSCVAGTPLRLGRNGALQPLHFGSIYGVLETHDAQLLELFGREGVDFELVWMQKQSQGGIEAENKAAVWATLYGPRDLAPDLYDLFQSLELYLQDPIYALRDVAYFNPQRFFNEPDKRTSHFKVASSNHEQITTTKHENLLVTDVLDGITADCDLPETPASPHLLTELMSHQMKGLTFMIRRESDWRLHDNGCDVWSQSKDSFGRSTYINNIDSSSHYIQPSSFRGGLIADLMGLGKSLTMISLIAQDKVLEKESRALNLSGKILGRGTILVMPPSLLHNWQEELSKHLSPEHFTWQCHHGQQRIQASCDIGFHDIVLTTYSTLAKELQIKEQSPIFSHNWHRVILDEAHEIKDLSTAKARAACALRASCRWAVTGTPIQNRLSEIFSLFHFLRLYPYSDKRSFDKAITNPWLCGDKIGLQALVKLLGYTMLRRSKKTITLPRRKDHRRFLNLKAQEQDAYTIAKEKAIECLEDALSSCKPQQGYRNALQKINSLKVICELGCMAQPDLHANLSNLVSYGSFLTPEVPDGASTPSKVMDKNENYECELEVVGSPLGDILFRLQESSPSSTTPASGLSPYSIDPPANTPVPVDYWPTKIQALIEDLQSCAAGTKSVVFSYRKSVLDVANKALRSVGIGCVQIDGRSNAKQRSVAINTFSHNETMQVLLLSLGCGAVGAYLLEPQWNPSIEEQALARIHRLGQTREVDTIRFVISDSIEQYVLDIQDGKRDLINLLTPNKCNDGQVMARLQQLRQLLL